MLIEALENASDEEIVEAGNKMRGRLVKKFVLGVVVSVAVHFASEYLVTQIDKKRNTEETD